MLGNEGLRDAFSVIVGGEDVSVHKPEPEGIFKAVDSMGVTISETIYVGDSVTDADAARRASVPFAAVLSGVTEARQFEPYGAVAIMKDLSELPAVIGV